jgi:adenosylcobyric acid synthase
LNTNSNKINALSGKEQTMAKSIMIQGTMSNAGKSLLVAALCRIFRQDGYRVAPFKSQNMALNSFITETGGEMGRAQVVQAEAAGIAPDVRMNPILLKPTTDMGSQVIVSGRVEGNMTASEYYEKKMGFLPVVMDAYNSLAREYDIIVIEGAGSPAEINLKRDDFVNMGLARLVDAPVLLVGDIDRGGVFAQLYGTIALLDADERARIKGTVVNKFRGDRSILEPGLKTLEDICGVPVAGVVPYIHVDIDDEDSLTERFHRDAGKGLIDIAVIRLPYISNFTDFAPFERQDNVSLRYVDHVGQLGRPDMIILPGTKSTIADLVWLRESGLEAAVLQAADSGTLVFGICGGYQMMGRNISDPEQVESAGLQEIRGMGFFETDTVFCGEKVQTQRKGVFHAVSGILAGLNGLAYEGYEIHLGRSEEKVPALMSAGNVYGSYIHGIFDAPGVCEAILKALCHKKGIAFEALETTDPRAYKERQYDILADAVRDGLDMDFVYRVLNREA